LAHRSEYSLPAGFKASQITFNFGGFVHEIVKMQTLSIAKRGAFSTQRKSHEVLF